MKVTVSFVKKAAIRSNIRDRENLDLLSCAASDWRLEPHLRRFAKARASGDNWECWGQVVFFVGEKDLVHVSQSPHHYEQLEDYVTITARQLDQIMADFAQFRADAIECERTY